MVSRLKQSLNFHASPETFIANRQQAFLENARPGLQSIQNNTVIEAQILDRNVHIVSSYSICRSILESSSGSTLLEETERRTEVGREKLPMSKPLDVFRAGPAYKALMADFFPSPNMLIEDGGIHREHKASWIKLLEDVPVTAVDSIKYVTDRHLVQELLLQYGQHVDLYDVLKGVAWDLLFALFLGLHREDKPTAFKEIESLQETLLRGQFSLLPVKIWTPIWASSRSKGIQASNSLLPLLLRQWQLITKDKELQKSDQPRCPFAKGISETQQEVEGEDVASHLRLFTSSISNKALASLLTSLFLNLYLWRPSKLPHGSGSLAKMIAQNPNPQERRAMISSILMETERLSPPVVGVMRRVEEHIILPETLGTSNHTVPAGHDAWLYLVGANRDEAIFDDANCFQWDRFMAASANDLEPLAFGAGSKQCLGMPIVRSICIEVAEAMILSDIQLDGEVTSKGVQDWLGWSGNRDFVAAAKDLKQLPCQRPRDPIIVRISSKSKEQV